MALFILFESASGYGLFERTEAEEVAEQSAEFQKSLVDIGKFSNLVALKGFLPFTSAENALENINDVSEGVLNPFLKNFLETNLPNIKKKSAKITLGVTEDKLATAIQDQLGIPCMKNNTVMELTRGLRLHFAKFIKELKEGELEKAQLGLGHSYSRSKVKFNVNRVDNMIIQSICLLDQLDKDLNTFAMRVREWYSWHFPELAKITSDNILFAKLAIFIKSKNNLSEDNLEELEEIVGDEGKAKEILAAAQSSMGTDISDYDMSNIEAFAKRVVQLHAYRQKLHAYLLNKMHAVAPNLSALIGEQVGARLISHAGSLTNLAKYPASTVQILGAEKALFRALKTKGNTPKYGLIFNSTFIGRASSKNKGRISRYLANKCSIASRIDAFSDVITDKFGQKLKEQVEERLKFYDSGELPKKNVDVMKEVMEELKTEMPDLAEQVNPDKKRKREKETPKKEGKKKKEESESEEEEEEEKEESEDSDESESEGKKKKEKKKDKKKKKEEKEKEKKKKKEDKKDKKDKKKKEKKEEKKKKKKDSDSDSYSDSDSD
eukprot:TRINITY_DN325_c0_g1_i1.p1 TRINITY_DN325_c0_g1~~TRINITY_DN325_c0_g1_i1.p1  ORF type:complete len:580 (+),score=283.47 TRINITY_DN325_c0_g1_i1:93-1742(+)